MAESPPSLFAHLRFPVGTFAEALAATPDYEAAVREIADFPIRLRELVAHLADDDLARTYRPGGWTVRQLVHHCADSHAHALLRTKRALAKETAAVAGYAEAPTAELPDYDLPVAPALAMLDGLHARFAALLRGITVDQRRLTYRHLEHARDFSVAQTAQVYAWHGRHHLAHVRIALGEPGT